MFYCYDECQLPEISRFFENNNNSSLKFGPKKDLSFNHISKDLINRFDRKDILKRVEDCFVHKAIPFIVENILLSRKEDSKRGSINDYEIWSIVVNSNKFEYTLSNFGNPTSEYNLTEIIKE